MSKSIERCITFECADTACVGILHSPVTPVSNLGVLIVVGGPQYRVGSHRQFVMLARDLAAAGYPVLRFDYRGMGDSAGGARDFRFVAEDLRAAVDAYLLAQQGLQKIIVFGLCDAASAALMHLVDDPRVAGLMLANPWVRTDTGLARAHVQHYYRGRVLQKTFWTKLLSGRFQLRRALSSFLNTLVKMGRAGGEGGTSGQDSFVQRMLAGLETFDEPILVLLSGRDLTAREFDDLATRDRRWSRALARATVTVERMPGADHTFAGQDAAKTIARQCTDWLRRSFDEPDVDA